METDGGGWTLFQQRVNDSENFYRNWTSYEEGFGFLTGNFWLGLSKLHQLTKLRTVTLLILLEDHQGDKAQARYATFSVSNSTRDYEIAASNYNGTAGDSLLHDYKGIKTSTAGFSSPDRDNDNWSEGNLAMIHKGGWWFDNCLHSNLNGQYNDTGLDMGIIWEGWKGKSYSLKKTTMMVR